MVDSLPWLDGVKLSRQGEGFAPIDGMATVSDLLATATLEAEPLYRTWRVVSLARLGSDDEIEVRTRGGLRVIFGTGEDFLRQLARLDIVLDTAGTDPAHPVAEDQSRPRAAGARHLCADRAGSRRRGAAAPQAAGRPGARSAPPHLALFTLSNLSHP